MSDESHEQREALFVPPSYDPAKEAAMQKVAEGDEFGQPVKDDMQFGGGECGDEGAMKFEHEDGDRYEDEDNSPPQAQQVPTDEPGEIKGMDPELERLLKEEEEIEERAQAARAVDEAKDTGYNFGGTEAENTQGPVPDPEPPNCVCTFLVVVDLSGRAIAYGHPELLEEPPIPLRSAEFPDMRRACNEIVVDLDASRLTQTIVGTLMNAGQQAQSAMQDAQLAQQLGVRGGVPLGNRQQRRRQ